MSSFERHQSKHYFWKCLNGVIVERLRYEPKISRADAIYP